MKKFAVAGMAALAIAASTAVYAHQGWLREHMQHMQYMRLSPEDRAALLDARIAAVHAGLKLTPDQEKLWPPVEGAVRDFAKLRSDRIAARMQAREEAQGQGQQAPEDPVTRLRQRADNMAASAAALKKIAEAADPLYKTLDDGQKRRLALLTHRGGRGGEGWRHRWMNRDRPEGRPDRDRDDGPERL